MLWRIAAISTWYLRRVQDAGGFFLIRAKAGMHPQSSGLSRRRQRLRSLRNKPLKAIRQTPQRQRGALVVTWQVEAYTLRLSPHQLEPPDTGFASNLPAKLHLDMLSCLQMALQVELLFKEWKSTPICTLTPQMRPSSRADLGAIAAAALKRFLAYDPTLARCPCPHAKSPCVPCMLRRDCQALKTGDVAGL